MEKVEPTQPDDQSNDNKIYLNVLQDDTKPAVDNNEAVSTGAKKALEIKKEEDCQETELTDDGELE